ncbi:hypothetical protein QUF76_05190 [Desulfobacterales bacterium HSG16]|nr:hypothetical protein [Desulfobacterales bacterium HSG16]
MVKKIFCFILIFAMAGCATSGDPTKGGLFGWSEKKADVRQDDLKNSLSEEERIGQEAKSATSLLEEERRNKEIELAAQKKIMSKLDTELNDIEKQIKKMKTTTSANNRLKKKYEGDYNKLKSELNKLKKGGSSLSVQKKKARIKKLDSDIEKLLQILSDI